jgi:regulator of protease activity HflC (stomatin/prohibitin superfamily)
VALPETMKRSMSRQAEAERERRARVISAEGELQASDRLAKAAHTMADTPGALQLRLLETIVQVSSEKNSTLVLPFPVELLRFLENNTSRTSTAQSAAEKAAEASEGGKGPAATEMLSSGPEVAALEAREPDQAERPTGRTANGLSSIPNGRSSAKDAG